MSFKGKEISRREFLSRGTKAAAGIVGVTALAPHTTFGAILERKEDLKMKVGMNLLLWTTHVSEEQFPLMADIKKTGFDGVEIPLGEGDAKHYRTVRKGLDAEGLECTTITSVTEETNPASPDPAIRRAAVDQLKWAIDMAAELNSPVIGGPFHSAYNYFTGKGPTDDEKKWSAEVLRKAAEYAKQRNVTLAIEFINRFECYLCNTVASALDLVGRVDHPNLGIHYDTHHANIEEKSISGAIGRAASKMKHVHISENDRGTPGSGLVDWDETYKSLHAIGYEGWLVIEAFSTAVPQFASDIHIWRDFAPTQEEIYREGYAHIMKMWKKYST